MKRYISSAYKYPKGYSSRIQYTSIDDLLKILKQEGFTPGMGYRGSLDTSGDDWFELDINLVSGPAKFIAYGKSTSPKFKVVFNGETLVEGSVYSLFSKSSTEYMKYKKISSAAPSRLSKAGDPDNIRKGMRADRARQNKQLSSYDIYRRIYTNGVSESVAIDAIDNLRNRITNDDWASLDSWELSLEDTKSESWASICVQGYGNDTTYTVKLTTPSNTYNTRVYRSQGWYTE